MADQICFMETNFFNTNSVPRVEIFYKIFSRRPRGKHFSDACDKDEMFEATVDEFRLTKH